MKPRWSWILLVASASCLAASCHAPSAEDARRGIRTGETVCGRSFEPASIDAPWSAQDDYMGDPALAPGADFRDHAPGPGPERAFVVPPIGEVRLSNGIRVLYVSRRDMPVVAIRVGVDRGGAGAAPGVGAFFGAMLGSGTECLPAAGIHAIARALGARFQTSTDYDSTFVSLKVLTPGLDDAVQLAADTLEASLEDHEIDKVRIDHLSVLAQRAERPASLLEDAIAGVVYPEGHPYAIPVLGTASAIKKVSTRDVRSFRDAYLRPERITVAVAGDVDPAQIARALELRFGEWRPTPFKAIAPRPLDVAPAGPPRTIVIDDRGASQSMLALSCVGAPRGAPDIAAIRVLARVLSWAFGKNLREQHGYTYGVSARFQLRRGAGPFIAGGAVAREHTADAVREMLAEIVKIRAVPPSPGVLRDAQRQLINENGATFETADETADALLRLAIHGLPRDEYATLPARLRAVTGEDVRRAAQRYLDPDRMHLVVIGDEPAIRRDLASLGRGAPEVRTLRRSRGGGAEPSDE